MLCLHLIFVIFLINDCNCKLSTNTIGNELIRMQRRDDRIGCPLECRCDYKDGQIYVSCKNGDLTTLPNHLDKNVVYLDLSENRFTSIPIDLYNYKRIEWLSLAHNNIARINNTDLGFAQNLHTFNVSATNVMTVLSIIRNLKHFKRIYHLDLQSNNLSDVFDTDSNRSKYEPLVLTSESLQILNLHNCSVKHIKNKYMFTNLTSLRVLILSKNYINWFTELVSDTIEILDLSECNINHIRLNAFRRMSALSTLYLNDNKHIQMYSSTAGIQHLMSHTIQTLHINSCNMYVEYITQLANLTHLYMSNNIIVNELTGNSFDTTNNKHLQVVDLSKCSIHHIHHATFMYLYQLTELDLSANRIENIHPLTFIYNTNLLLLNLSWNHIARLDQSLQSISLIHLDISHNMIDKFAFDSFINLTNLIELNLSYNYIEHVPNHFTSHSLQHLDIGYNQLYEFNQFTFLHLEGTLRTLVLSGNRFYKPFNLTTPIESIQLYDNPWICDCSSTEFRVFYDYLTANQLVIDPQHQLICYSPTNYTHMSWQYACRKQWYKTSITTLLNNQGNTAHLERVWLFLIVTFVTLTVIFCVVSNARRIVTQRAHREQLQMERLANEARDRLRVIRDRQAHSLNNLSAAQNAPDPRDLISPPSYEEALSMLRPSVTDLRLKRHPTANDNDDNTRNTRRLSDAEASDASSSRSFSYCQEDNNEHDTV